MTDPFPILSSVFVHRVGITLRVNFARLGSGLTQSRQIGVNVPKWSENLDPDFAG